MKRIYLYIVMAVCALMMVGCQKDMIGEISAYIEEYGFGDDKVYIDRIGDVNYPCWHDGDHVNVNGQMGTIEIDDVNHAIVKGVNIADMSQLYAVYPASFVGDGRSIVLPEKQVYREQKKRSGEAEMVQVVDAPMTAMANIDENCNADLIFKNTGSLMKVHVAGFSKVYQIKVIAKDEGVLLNGTANYTQEEGAVPVLSELVGGSNMIVLDMGAGIDVNVTKDFYIAIPNVTSAFDIEVYGIANNEERCNVYTTHRNTIARNTMVTLDLDRTPTSSWEVGATEEKPYIIGSAEDFNRYMNANVDRVRYYKLMNDINLGSNYPGISQFMGVLDGNGHTITYESSTSGMINRLAGSPTIKNLTINTLVLTGSGITHIGGLANKSEGDGITSIINCRVIGGRVEGASRVGGFIGGLSNSLYMDRCISSTWVNGNDMLGGLIGEIWTSSAITIRNCANLIGVYANTSNKQCAKGGLIGKATFWGGMRIENCYSLNYLELYEGAIFGYIKPRGVYSDAVIENVYVKGVDSRIGNGYWMYFLCELEKGAQDANRPKFINVYRPNKGKGDYRSGNWRDGSTVYHYNIGDWSVIDQNQSVMDALNANRQGHDNWAEWTMIGGKFGFAFENMPIIPQN